MSIFSKEQFARAFDEGLRRDQRESWQKQTAEAYLLWLAWKDLRIDDILGNLQTSLLEGGGVGPETLVLKLTSPADSRAIPSDVTRADFLIAARSEKSPWLLSVMRGGEIFPITEDSSLFRLLDGTKDLEVGKLKGVAITRQIFTPVLPVSQGRPFYFGGEVQDVSLLFFHLYRTGLYLNGQRLIGFEQAMLLGSRNLEARLVSFLSESI